MTRPFQLDEAKRLAALHELDLLHAPGFPELDRLTRLAADICGADPSVLTIFDERRSVQLSVSSGKRIDVGADPTLCAMTLAANETVLIPDARADPATATTFFVAGPPYARSYVGTPVGADPDMPVGVLCIAHSEPNRFGHAEMARLSRRLVELDQEHPLLPDRFIVPGRGVQLAYEPDPGEVSLLGYTRNDVTRAVREVVSLVGPA